MIPFSYPADPAERPQSGYFFLGLLEAAETNGLIMRPKASPSCPACGSLQVAEVVYGLPMLDQLRPDLEAGRVILGGCCLFEDSPQWKCHACGHEWGRPASFHELHRLRQEAEALPKSLWRRLQAFIGIS